MAGKTSKKSAKATKKTSRPAGAAKTAKSSKTAGKVPGEAPKEGPRKAPKKAGKEARKEAGEKAAKPKLLSGGNPQIAKGYGDEPVQAYIAAMPDWKQDIGRRLDAIIEREVPSVRKAVKWNSPFYGVEDESKGWFVSFHVFTKYVKVTFFRGASLRPTPAGKSKYEEVRYLDIYEGELDEAQFASWVKQASQLPGERM